MRTSTVRPKRPRLAACVALVVLTALAVLGLAVVSADAATPAFRYGVAAGEITSTSAILWTRAPSAAPLELELGGRARLPVNAPARAADLTVRLEVEGLRPSTRYSFRFRQGRRVSATGPLHDGASLLGERARSVRDLGRRRRDAGLERQAGVQPLRGLRSHGGGEATTSTSTSATRSTRTARSAALRSRATVRAEVGEVPARARASGAPERSARRRGSTATGTTTSSSTTSRERRAARRSTAQASRPSSTTRRSRRRPRSVSTARSAGGSTSSSSSSTSARSAARRPTSACDGDLAPTAPQAVRDAFATLAPGARRARCPRRASPR